MSRDRWRVTPRGLADRRGKGERVPSEKELAAAKLQTRHVDQIAKDLSL